ncbi:MAG: F0F1 ATP synthase subunit B', partial [Proteobacteria bacterium]|nr:F0F1 ATP synthase subunit B' [Pseudomonadota bacterium]
MPQLATGDFVPQLVWLAITFIALYVVMWRVALPRIVDVLEERQRRIDDDLLMAES